MIIIDGAGPININLDRGFHLINPSRLSDSTLPLLTNRWLE